MKIAAVFPGQGSQYVGMGKVLVAAHPVARQAMQEADDHLGFSLTKTIFEGTEQELQKTELTQPALLATSIAADRVLRSRGFQPDVVLGHSLGEYSALVSVGAFDFGEALRAVRARGQFMQEAVPEGVGAMAAMIGLSEVNASSLCEAVRSDLPGKVLEIAGLNAPGQVVLAGHREAVETACKRIRDFGGRKGTILRVSAPFHCSLMKPAKDRMQPVLEKLQIRRPEVPYIPNVTADLQQDPLCIASLLGQQICKPVRWQPSIDRLFNSLHVKRFVEVGPGQVLSGLIRRSIPETAQDQVQIAASDCSDPAMLEETLRGCL